ncbi:MAG: sulfotransferase [Xanthomonadales bacterium]|nr:sulfotransferase [Xanthomonadales bacterium]
MLPNFAELFDRPVIILAAPRSGSTLLFETLAVAKDTWTIGGESHHVIEGLQSLNPNSGMVDSNRLTADHVNEQMVQLIRSRFARLLKDRDGQEFFRRQDIKRLRFLEKTPKNSLRLPFMEKIFPDALYIFLFRDVRANLSSMMEAWKARRWVTYPNLKGWRGPPWSLLLPPGWQQLSGRPLEEICAFQWESANRILLDDLEKIPRQRWTTINYQLLVDDPESAAEHLCTFAGLEIDEHLRQRVQKPLPLSRFTHTQPAVDKWRKNEIEIESVLDSLAGIEARLQTLGYARTQT